MSALTDSVAVAAVDGKRVIVALDFDAAASALTLVDRLDPAACRVKIGKELFVAAGPRLVEEVVGRGFEVFLDLKFHDIPNTVAQACKAAARLGVWMVNVHASGGKAMLTAARRAIDSEARRPLLIGVTLLTSLGDDDLPAIGFSGTAATVVMRLATLAGECGLDGVVCSGQEATALRAAQGPAFKLVTPGIRPVGSDAADQARILTPQSALALGADYLVIGRPITRAGDPLAALSAINHSLQSVSAA